MKILFINISLALLLFVSCKKDNSDLKPSNAIPSIQKETQNPKEDNLDLCENKDTLTFQNDSLTVKSEFIMRGDGVLTLDISDKLIIYNQDDSIFGEISLTGESTYDINLPKTITARYFIPMFDQFAFDANKPKDNNDYLEIFINKELKKIKKSIVSYQYETWSDYVKKSFINIRNCKSLNENITDKNTYEIIKIRKDSMDIKSISKNSCDAIASFVDTKKTIRWKKNKELLIYFYECN